MSYYVRFKRVFFLILEPVPDEVYFCTALRLRNSYGSNHVLHVPHRVKGTRKVIIHIFIYLFEG